MPERKARGVRGDIRETEATLIQVLLKDREMPKSNAARKH